MKHTRRLTSAAWSLPSSLAAAFLGTERRLAAGTKSLADSVSVLRVGGRRARPSVRKAPQLLELLRLESEHKLRRFAGGQIPGEDEQLCSFFTPRPSRRVGQLAPEGLPQLGPLIPW